MKAVWAILSVLFFHGIVIIEDRDISVIGSRMANNPLFAVGLGIPMFLMAGSCFGKQTAAKRKVGLAGVIILQLLCVLAHLVSRDFGVTLLTSVPFIGSSTFLLVRRLREDPEKEAAAREAKIREFRLRTEQIRSALSKKPPSTP